MYADPDNSLLPHRALWMRCHCYFDFLDEEPSCLDGKAGWMGHASQVPVYDDCSHMGTSVFTISHPFNISAPSAGIKVPCEAWFWKQCSSFLGSGFQGNPPSPPPRASTVQRHHRHMLPTYHCFRSPLGACAISFPFRVNTSSLYLILLLPAKGHSGPVHLDSVILEAQGLIQLGK